MADMKIDYLIEAVRLQADGQIDYARLYERRGSSYSDRVLYPREKLLSAFRLRKTIYTGVRQPGMASTFTNTVAVQMGETDGRIVIYNTEEIPEKDHLRDVPLL